MPDHEKAEQKTATDAGLEQQADELSKEHAENVEDAPDPRNPEEWRDAPKEGGGA